MLSNTSITGRLTATPQLRETPKGHRVTALRVAVNDHRLEGAPRYIDVEQWEDAAADAAKHLVRGQQITAEGILDARPYTTEDGELRVGWTMSRARVEWGPKPLSDLPIDRLIDEAGRRRRALVDDGDVAA